MLERVRARTRFVATCACYLGAFACLLTFGKAPRHVRGTVGRLFARWNRRLNRWRPESGYCYLAKIPAGLTSDTGGTSRVVVFENGVPLPSPHASHDEIRKHGMGAYSHWNDSIYLSTSDNSDPRTNGRRYTYAEV
ncbi:MAG: hypothetical protein IT429_09350 [Gemmataceae bacterium]|nr:hypothetical protein [Gemmataceae bacterium]